MKINITTKGRLRTTLSGLLLSSFLMSPAMAAPLSLPDWHNFFNEDGTLKDSVVTLGIPDASDYGSGAIFVEDNISDGLATDMSALRKDPNSSELIVYNGVVDAVHDLGNLYVYGEHDASDSNYYVGIEHLSGKGLSHIDFDFKQEVTTVYQANSFIHGGHKQDDVKIRVNLTDGAATSIELYRWQDGGQGSGSGSYSLVTQNSMSTGSPCAEILGAYITCSGAVWEALAPTNSDVWDVNGSPVPATNADAFIELGVNMSWLMNSESSFETLVVSTPQDVIFAPLKGKYRNVAYWE